jgi:hypothetical protein
VPEFPVDPTDLLRAVDRQIRAAIGTTTGTADVSAAINRLADEAARLNRNIEELKPTIEALERHLGRSTVVVDSVQGIQQIIRRTMGGGSKPSTDTPGDPEPGSADPGEPLR